MKNYKPKGGYGKKKPGGSGRPYFKKRDEASPKSDFKKPMPYIRKTEDDLEVGEESEVIESQGESSIHPSHPRSSQQEDGGSAQWIYGLQTVTEALRRGLTFKKIYLRKKDAGLEEAEAAAEDKRTPDRKILKLDKVEEIIALCKEKKIQFYFAEPDFFLSRFAEKNHQWVVAELKGGARQVPDLAEHLDKIPTGRTPLVLLLDRITDQQNLGAIARSAYFFGCDLVVMETHHAAPVDETVHRVSSGASLLIPFYFCEKLSSAVETLRSKKFKIFGTVSHEEGQAPAGEKNPAEPAKEFPLVELREADFKGPTAIFLGSEGPGLRPHLVRMCDKLIWIKGYLGFDSLNVGSAGAVLLYEARRQLGV